MRFLILLFLLAVKLKSASKKKPNFIKKLKLKNITGVIKTADGKKGRTFVINNGMMTSQRGIADLSNFAIVWSDGATAYRVMSSGNNNDFIESIAQNKLKIEGNGMEALWFLQLTKDMNY